MRKYILMVILFCLLPGCTDQSLPPPPPPPPMPPAVVWAPNEAPVVQVAEQTLLPLMQACNGMAPLRFLAEAMDCRLVSNRNITPDKPTFHEELLDTYQALVDYHRAMLEGLPPDVVGKKRETLIRQLKEDFAFYVARGGGGDG